MSRRALGPQFGDDGKGFGKPDPAVTADGVAVHPHPTDMDRDSLVGHLSHAHYRFPSDHFFHMVSISSDADIRELHRKEHHDPKPIPRDTVQGSDESEHDFMRRTRAPFKVKHTHDKHFGGVIE